MLPTKRDYAATTTTEGERELQQRRRQQQQQQRLASRIDRPTMDNRALL